MKTYAYISRKKIETPPHTFRRGARNNIITPARPTSPKMMKRGTASFAQALLQSETAHVRCKPPERTDLHKGREKDKGRDRAQEKNVGPNHALLFCKRVQAATAVSAACGETPTLPSRPPSKERGTHTRVDTAEARVPACGSTAENITCPCFSYTHKPLGMVTNGVASLVGCVRATRNERRNRTKSSCVGQCDGYLGSR